jgi:hypothetical protein
LATFHLCGQDPVDFWLGGISVADLRDYRIVRPLALSFIDYLIFTHRHLLSQS